jgi:hypothetical protein
VGAGVLPVGGSVLPGRWRGPVGGGGGGVSCQVGGGIQPVGGRVPVIWRERYFLLFS